MKTITSYNLAPPNIGPAPVVPYTPSVFAASVGNAPLPAMTTSTVPWATSMPLFYTAALVSAWGTRASNAPANLSSATPAVKAMAQDWVAAAYIAERLVAGDYAAFPASVSSDVYWGNAAAPTSYTYQVANAAFVYRTGYDRNGTVMSGANKTALFNAIRNWLVPSAQSNWLDLRLSGFRTPASGVSVTNSSSLETFVFQRVMDISAMVFIYDMIRSDMTSSDRLIVENFFRVNGDWLKQAMERQLLGAFPSWKYDRYDDASAVATTSDGTTEFYNANATAAYDFVDSTPATGTRVTKLAIYYNNRVSNSATALGLIGLVLDETAFIAPAIRYYRDFLAYSVSSTGSISEWGERAYNYGIPQQGRIYASSTVGGMAVFAMALYRAKGEQCLFTYNTSKGLLGRTGGTKSLALVLDVQCNLFTRTGAQANWYAFNPYETVLASQVRNNTVAVATNTTLATHLGTQELRFLGANIKGSDMRAGGTYAGGVLPGNNLAFAESYHDVAAICAYEYYNTLGATVPSGTSKTGTVLAGAINAVAQRSVSLWTTAIGSAPTVMPDYPGTVAIGSTVPTVDAGRGSLNVVVPSVGTFATHGTQDGVIPAPLAMYAP
jgi:hypothetical protein